MKRFALLLLPTLLFAADLPPAASRPIDFQKDIQPLFEAACVKCHAKGKEKGGFSLETHAGFEKGGDTGPAVVPGKSEESLLVKLVASSDPDERMPKKGTKWTDEQIGRLRAWIDQGAKWPDGVMFAKPRPHNLEPRKVDSTPGDTGAVDRILEAYFAERKESLPGAVPDHVFARRAYLDVTGLLPTPAQLDAYEKDPDTDKRRKLVQSLLGDRRRYAEHWMTFWNDLLRNDYQGTGFIDGGRKQISGWLYTALYDNKPYDRFVSELVNPTPASEGFVEGILWRGNVNASMTRPMQAAQSVSQVFMGINLKCASCHDSFVNDWALADAYGLAAVYSDDALELVECDKPTGRPAAVRFLYPELGAIDPNLDKPARMKRLAEILTDAKNGRLSRTIVNRLWARLMGRGLVEPLDDMDQPAWSEPLMDWLAEDLVAHHWDLKRTISVILTSRAYAMPSVDVALDEKAPFAFSGPITRRMTAEQLNDAVSALGEDWARLPASLEFNFGTEGFTMPRWIWTSESLDLGVQRSALRAAQAQLDAAVAKVTAAAVRAAESPASAREAGKALAAAAAELDQGRKSLAAAAEEKATGQPGEWVARPDSDRHAVAFRKVVKLPGAPKEAYAVAIASQSFEVTINGGKAAKAIMSDGFRNGRVKLYDVSKLLHAGDNVIAISVDSHSGKVLNASERGQYPQSINHLNRTPGVAFYLHCEMGTGVLEFASDASWKSRRAPVGNWTGLKTDDPGWAGVSVLPDGVSPVDEGPGLKPIRRRDFSNLPVSLGESLAPSVSIAAHVGETRSSLLGADPFQTAMDRPNREIVVPTRASMATTIQALELTNGATLDARLRKASAKLVSAAANDPAAWFEGLFRALLSRPPGDLERAAGIELLGKEPRADAVADLLWAIINLPEFQLIH